MGAIIIPVHLLNLSPSAKNYTASQILKTLVRLPWPDFEARGFLKKGSL